MPPPKRCRIRNKMVFPNVSHRQLLLNTLPSDKNLLFTSISLEIALHARPKISSNSSSGVPVNFPTFFWSCDCVTDSVEWIHCTRKTHILNIFIIYQLYLLQAQFETDPQYGYVRVNVIAVIVNQNLSSPGIVVSHLGHRWDHLKFLPLHFSIRYLGHV